MYLRGLFQEALDLGLAELVREETSDEGKDGREQQILDISMRCATQLHDVPTAIRLADKTVGKVRCFIILSFSFRYFDHISNLKEN